jgi:hypothetical protein
MLPAGILAFMLPVEPEEGFYADPPIQRSMHLAQSTKQLDELTKHLQERCIIRLLVILNYT